MNDERDRGLPRRIARLGPPGAASGQATGADADPDTATTDDVLESIVIEALDRLPEPFRERLGSVAIVIEDEPTAAQLAAVGARGLFGLYQGVPRTTYGAEQVAVPSKITLFRGPLVRAHRTPERLVAGVTDTVYHEIAHHFGISDTRLQELRRGR